MKLYDDNNDILILFSIVFIKAKSKHRKYQFNCEGSYPCLFDFLTIYPPKLSGDKKIKSNRKSFQKRKTKEKNNSI